MNLTREQADRKIAKIKESVKESCVRFTAIGDEFISKINSMVEPEPAPKFPIGTRVQINPEVGKTIKKNIRGWNNSWNSLKMDEYIGMIGEIIEINWMGYRLKFLDGECWSFHESHLLPVPPEPEFEVGDWVLYGEGIYQIDNITPNGALCLSGLQAIVLPKKCQKVPFVQLPGEKPAQGKWAKTKVDRGSHRTGSDVLLVKKEPTGNWRCFYNDNQVNHSAYYDYYTESELEML